MQGKRIESPFGLIGDLKGEWPNPGEYWIRKYVGFNDEWKAEWHAVTPDGRDVNLANHQVTEHEDGTITVSPSILVWGGGQPGEWHGYLERGVWRSC